MLLCKSIGYTCIFFVSKSAILYEIYVLSAYCIHTQSQSQAKDPLTKLDTPLDFHLKALVGDNQTLIVQSHLHLAAIVDEEKRIDLQNNHILAKRYREEFLLYLSYFHSLCAFLYIFIQPSKILYAKHHPSCRYFTVTPKEKYIYLIYSTIIQQKDLILNHY